MKSLNRSFCSTTGLPPSRTFSAGRFTPSNISKPINPPKSCNYSIQFTQLPSTPPNFIASPSHSDAISHHLPCLGCSPTYRVIYIGSYCELFSLSLYSVLSRVLCRVLSRSLSSRCGRCTSRSEYTELSDWSEMDYWCGKLHLVPGVGWVGWIVRDGVNGRRWA